jgi:hypothetical protein
MPEEDDMGATKSPRKRVSLAKGGLDGLLILLLAVAAPFGFIGFLVFMFGGSSDYLLILLVVLAAAACVLKMRLSLRKLS